MKAVLYYHTDYTVEIPTFGELTGVSKPRVPWMSLTLGKQPSVNFSHL